MQDRSVQSVLDSIDPDGLVELARGMVRIPSQIPNEGPLAEFLAAEMRRSRLFDEVILQTVVAGRPNVVGVIRGEGDGPNVALNGHMDSLLPIGAWTRDPYSPDVKDGWLYGLSLTDMKAGLACLIEAARAVARSDARRRGSIFVTAVMHHGIPGLGTKFFLASWDRPIHAAINGEPTNLKVQTAHGGCWQFELTTHGVAVHNSRREEGIDAIRKMMRVLSTLDESCLTVDAAQSIPGLPRMVVGVIEGGPAPSRTAARCLARGDNRNSGGMTQDTLLADFERYLDRLRAEDPDLRVDVAPVVYQRPFRIASDAPIVRSIAEAHRLVTGELPEISDGLPASAYVTDAPDFVRHGASTVVYGPGDWKVEPDERIRIADMLTATKTYAVAIARIVSGEPGSF
jgi:acetylornithine deacetylase/succinyl-diaminopimelate desuccinylase-like protein